MAQKGWPRLDMYLSTRKVGGSRRRARNAVNMWAADTLRHAQRAGMSPELTKLASIGGIVAGFAAVQLIGQHAGILNRRAP